ncbi:hypothetical protein MCOR27_008381 [Pyricularia oryzae]|uniref:G domain-containing protein n=1 Tax=Pyricularia grisea TaxID=148305 RepID=A0ABQ8NA83_PYRGI|nr:hypothetical protein MCOR01_009990 [Pyricularia oryzae]KAI6293819.1 hypothetical protein MCOR33_008890 [Pyricularia grisea]KAI6258992.1 hypothetical protein MCOR19_004645 [Pyricularia oryzae]KAI6272315.1 hypothetical protein MCOR27_008381 [Pyricularia oryzae]KAI6272369.1 hypothetical protein MCOR26_007410 [Pyricularia oryzae]
MSNFQDPTRVVPAPSWGLTYRPPAIEDGVDSGLEDDEEEQPIEPDDPKIFRDGRAPRETDIFIAVMGVTGCGKSSLISLCCKRPVRIGHDLQACTAVVDVYPFELSPTQTVFLIDTPGFDDTNRSDSDVLREIASWLTNSFRNKILLHGIIYLHRISDPRMQGSARKNLMMFKKLCGDDALKKVILATTMWDIVPTETAEARQAELVNTPEFWGYMVEKGSRICRHHNTIGSARKIIESLIQDRNTMVLELQNQMVNESRPLQDTAAGMELRKEFARERKRWERELRETQENMEEAIRLRDKESEEALLELKTEYTERIERLEREHDKLRTNAEQLHQERIVRFRNAFKVKEIVRGKGHEEDQGDPLDAPTFSYSMVGGIYCFTGPVTYWFNCLGRKSRDAFERIITPKRSYCALWAGVGGAWICKYRNHGGNWATRYNKTLVELYPNLRQKIQTSRPWVESWPHWICMGPAPHYILQWNARATAESRQDAFLPVPVAEVLKKVRVDGVLQAAALGFNTSYVFVDVKGKATWDLGGHYPGLKRRLEQHSTDIEVRTLLDLSKTGPVSSFRHHLVLTHTWCNRLWL